MQIGIKSKTWDWDWRDQATQEAKLNGTIRHTRGTLHSLDLTRPIEVLVLYTGGGGVAVRRASVEALWAICSAPLWLMCSCSGCRRLCGGPPTKGEIRLPAEPSLRRRLRPGRSDVGRLCCLLRVGRSLGLGGTASPPALLQEPSSLMAMLLLLLLRCIVPCRVREAISAALSRRRVQSHTRWASACGGGGGAKAVAVFAKQRRPHGDQGSARIPSAAGHKV